MTNPHDHSLPDPSLDPEAQRIALERDRSERAWRQMVGSAIEEGIAIGHQEGRDGIRREMAKAFARQLTKKFGPLTEDQRDRLEAADLATLDRWFDAIIGGATADDLFRQ
jgi:hypothetical protein